MARRRRERRRYGVSGSFLAARLHARAHVRPFLADPGGYRTRAAALAQGRTWPRPARHSAVPDCGPMEIRPKLTGQQVARVGEHLVAAEIHLRGGYAAMFAGNMPGVDLLASDAQRTRTVHVQVK